MKFIILNVLFALALASDDYDEKNQEKRSLDPNEGIVTGIQHVPQPQLVSQLVEVEKVVPVVRYQGIPVHVPHPVPYAVHVPVHVPQPVPVEVPVPVPVYKTVTVPVEKPVPYPVEKPIPVHIYKKVPVPVPKPYPVPVPVYRTKHIYHEIHHSKGHGWW